MYKEIILGITICAVLCNIGIPIWIHYITIRIYEQTRSVPKALRVMSYLKMYVHYVITLLGAFALYFFYFAWLADYTPSRMMLLLCTFCYITLSMLYGQWMFHKVDRRIRQTETTFIDEIGITLREIFIIFTPVLLYKGYQFVIEGQWVLSEWQQVMMWVVFVIGLQLLYPYLLMFYFQAKPIQNRAISLQIHKLLYKLQVAHTQIYEFPTKKRKTADAWATGIWHKKIFIADYLLDKLTPAQLQAIVAHEIGHCKKNHNLWKFVLFISVYPAYLVFEALWTQCQLWFNLQHETSMSLVTTLSFFVCYFLFIYRKASHYFEHQADLYALQVAEKQEIISALQKIAEINYLPVHERKLTNQFKSHPSVNDRIRMIVEASQQKQLYALRK